MKIGFRKPSLKKRIKARTTGALKREIKKSINPFYGKKGMGIIRDPKKALYNKIYNKVTIDPLKIKIGTKRKKSTSQYKSKYSGENIKKEYRASSSNKSLKKHISLIPYMLGTVVLFMAGIISINARELGNVIFGIFYCCLGIMCYRKYRKLRIEKENHEIMEKEEMEESKKREN